MTAATVQSGYSTAEVLQGLDDGFNKFNSVTYNKLPKVEDADAQLKQSNVLNQFLSEAQILAAKHGVQDFIGVRLAHRHFMPMNGDYMVEYNETSKKGMPTLVTRMQQGIDAETTFPASWVLGENGYEVFEYSTDSCVKARNEELKQKDEFFKDFFSLAKKYNVENLLVPAILERKIFEQLTEETACSEKSYVNPSRSVVRLIPTNIKKAQIDKITTAWMLNPIPMTFSCIASFWCVKNLNNHYPYNRHNKF